MEWILAIYIDNLLFLHYGTITLSRLSISKKNKKAIQQIYAIYLTEDAD